MNCKRFEVYFLPSLIPATDWSNASIVMTDVLRASTTMIAALTSGAATIWPHAKIESARAARADVSDSLLCGERGGKIIEGFDCGNSPREYPPEVVAGKTMIHCTTNGTLALESCRGASSILIGAFVNLDAIVDELLNASTAIVLCAGTDGQVTGEDVLFAGAVGAQLKSRSQQLEMSDQAEIAISHWTSAESRLQQGESLSSILAKCRGGRPLVNLGFQADIEFSAQLNHFQAVPRLDQSRWRIELA